MKFTLVPHGEQVSFEEFCSKHGITIEVHERSSRLGLPRYYASARPLVKIRENGTLCFVRGDGDTPEEAYAAYAAQLEDRKLLIGGYDGVEVVTPNEWKE